jgi:murein DD-endopeptidase MepM/ murein hydrolase activator NlpD
MIMRDPGQESVYLIVNTATEHLRLRYLHMRPKLLDANAVLSGRRVKAGEVIGQVGNYSGHENGTSYHLHFDIQVPTRAGWVFVSPYMTLVAAYERLIGARGEELHSDALASAAPTTINDAIASAITLASVRHAILAPAESAVADVDPAPQLAAPSPCPRASRHRHARSCDTGHADHRNMRYGHHSSRSTAWHHSRSRHRL